MRRIHLDSDEEDKPGIRAYGLPKKRLQDNGLIERLHLGQDRIDDTSKSARLVNIFNQLAQCFEIDDLNFLNLHFNITLALGI